MKLLPLETPELIELASSWLACKDNYQWLDFGGGVQMVTPALLKIMTQRETHFMRVYTTDDDVPIGIAGLNSVNHDFKTATLWGATGEKSFGNRGYATFAGSMILSLGFRELGLYAINTWAVAHNPSVRLIERLNFRLIGRQRQCHYIDGHAYDRLFYDLLATEHRELERGRPQRTEESIGEVEHAWHA